MKQTWTVINGIMITLSMSVGVILVFYITNIITKTKMIKIESWICIVGGLFIVFICHSIWGLLYEMSKNIYHLKGNFDNEDNSDTDEEELWTCSVCSYKNPDGYAYCPICGASRFGNQQQIPQNITDLTQPK